MSPRQSSRNVEMLGGVANGLKEEVFLSAARRSISTSRINRWYGAGIANAEQTALPNGESVSIFSIPYLLASKLEAFHGRGNGDIMMSKDIEDVITLLDGCPDAERKIADASTDVREYLQQEFARLLTDKLFLVSLEGHLTFGPGVRDRLARCLAIMRGIAT